MLVIVKSKANEELIKKAAEDFDGIYIKVVVDVEREILAAGGERHFDAEQKLLEDGSIQANLWGGGVDVKSGEIDYNSMINLRPNQSNMSREIMSEEIRKKFDKIVKELLI
ncbi:hypothetical protein A3I53_03465 [Candidatus Curtissbacteria bacterium RIFCSPLOWO2_02_FULL_40_13b]|uniref:Uncharacterized protein n=3 Tax=Candidatus Curtissiibacteriota TaxID=1752717 RepID=A0A1F5HP06_9BACT|nr:MAG: hypothetical protein A2693_01355 [Candidatus Curtissbacteria bacterium RIFCSPHIGHO2_01_FULL_40_12]OGE04889.1 MAG: hypothetical protein A3F45_01490 [Candidatus Curtissbacteria bacterium RIFCSPHIGHO2_12_FULL_41_17]OGE05897.1 MAG: hypothetical protein A3I53_03465 [Candidatus Curtissbacteria bacterium RIFCSPLOWO2_02_FULL_40_13b]